MGPTLFVELFNLRQVGPFIFICTSVGISVQKVGPCSLVSRSSEDLFLLRVWVSCLDGVRGSRCLFVGLGQRFRSVPLTFVGPPPSVCRDSLLGQMPC